ncbi:hypothetical protein [Blastococcus sp. SYSU DS0828]
MVPVVVDEGRPDGARRPLAGSQPGPGRGSPDRTAAPAVWVDGGARLAITTWGSSSAPGMPVDVEVEGGRLTVSVAVRDSGGGAMSADLAAHVTVIETPAGLDPHDWTVLRIHGRDHDLPPVGAAPPPRLTLRPAGPNPVAGPDPG